MDRRNFIKNSTLTGIAFTIFPSSYSFSSVLNTQNKKLLTHQPLPIPTLVDTTKGETIYLNVNNGKSNFYEDTITRTSGINTDYLGPALKMHRGKTANIQVNNNLDETITLHWHGLEIPGNKDGGPHQMIEAGEQWRVELPITQPAATCWFHPHQYPQTAELVMRGIAGLILIEDEESDALDLPSDWGVNDVPIIIQDRKFDSKGQFDYKLLDIVNVSTGFVGDTVLVNGAIHPILDVPQGWSRLRVLNGSNARSYQLSFSDHREFYVVASDSGFLTAPVVMKSLQMSAGERFEILIEVDGEGQFDLVTHPLHQMGMMSPPFNEIVALMTLKPNKNISKGMLPNYLTTITRYKLGDVKKKRNIVLEMGEGLDSQAMMIMRQRKSALANRLEMVSESKKSMPMMKNKNAPKLTRDDLKNINSINGKSFNMEVIDAKVNKGELEHWVISQGKDMMVHPFHIHGCRFQVLSVNGEPPEPHLMGWKDTVTVFPKGETEVLVKFEHIASEDYPYMAHCHILEHEDTGMMMQFTVA
ncbi:multicopper oxidase CueO [Vibrio mediterranei]|uniref:multicopper oxidase CueO n=1 Tax=Vibrio mediterranei TaxID=689 RepID=UPI002283DCE1|nr:multicopper oxidase CueO [Vibrio mediterranei]MCY9855663.1 multicopper oxidase CueO [Vibrio mediterranei]